MRNGFLFSNIVWFQYEIDLEEMKYIARMFAQKEN